MTGEIEQRLELLEQAGAVAFQLVERNRYEIAALRIVLCTLLDDVRPDDPLESDGWFDHLHDVSTRNLNLNLDWGEEAVSRVVGPSADRTEATEEERAAVGEMLDHLYSVLRTPKGGMEDG